MNKINAILLAVFAMFLFSCEEQPKKKKSDGSEFNRDENTKLEDEVMRIHDEVMPLMSDIQRLTREIKLKLDSSDHFSEEYKDELKRALGGLRQADQAMWDWMYTYKPDSLQDKVQKKLYLVDERQEIRTVARKMHNSIEFAKVTLDNEPAPE